MKKDSAQYKGLLSVLIEDNLFTLHFALLLWREGRNKASAHLITRFYL